jgi:ribosome-associated protein
VVFNTEHLSPLFERVIIASGTSNRQTKALASSVRDAVKQKGLPPPRVEGEDNGEWIIVDCGAAVVHVMQPAIREYYHLEEIWGDKPVKLKIDTSPVKLVKAEVPPKAARKPAARAGAKTAAPKAPARKAAARTASPAKASTAKTSTARATPPRAPAKKAVTRTVGVKKTVVVNAPARSASKAPAKTAAKTAAKVSPKAPAKSPARKTPRKP